MCWYYIWCMELVKYGILWLGSELGGIFYKLHVALWGAQASNIYIRVCWTKLYRWMPFVINIWQWSYRQATRRRWDVRSSSFSITEPLAYGASVCEKLGLHQLSPWKIPSLSFNGKTVVSSRGGSSSSTSISWTSICGVLKNWYALGSNDRSRFKSITPMSPQSSTSSNGLT